jgi:hypothetical protein
MATTADESLRSRHGVESRQAQTRSEGVAVRQRGTVHRTAGTGGFLPSGWAYGNGRTRRQAVIEITTVNAFASLNSIRMEPQKPYTPL